jgi:hypothetical protein
LIGILLRRAKDQLQVPETLGPDDGSFIVFAVKAAGVVVADTDIRAVEIEADLAFPDGDLDRSSEEAAKIDVTEAMALVSLVRR